MRVSVCFHQRFWGFYLADQLYKRDALAYLYTAYFGSWGSRRNDHGVNIPRSKIRTHLLSAGLIYGYNPRDSMFAERIFGNWAGKRLSNEDIVVTLGQATLPIVERAKEQGIVTVMERGSSHATFQRDILLEEYERWGVAADELRRSFSEERMEQELLEYELADYIAIPSSFVEKTFVDEGIPERKIIKNPYGVGLEEFRQLPKQDDVFRVVFAGGMSLRKGVHYLLQAFAELDLPNAELWLIGSKSPEIEPFFKKYEGKFRYIENQPQAKLHELYSQCSVFALCSIEEGYGMVLLQGMACGLPLICTPNTGGIDAIEDGREGFVVPIRDVDVLKASIVYLYEDQDLCYEMGQKAKRKVQEGFTWDDYGDRAFRSYQAILGKR